MGSKCLPEVPTYSTRKLQEIREEHERHAYLGKQMKSIRISLRVVSQRSDFKYPRDTRNKSRRNTLCRYTKIR